MITALLIFAIWQVVGLATWLRIALTVGLGLRFILSLALDILKVIAKRQEDSIKRCEEMTKNIAKDIGWNNEEYSE